MRRERDETARRSANVLGRELITSKDDRASVRAQSALVAILLLAPAGASDSIFLAGDGPAWILLEVSKVIEPWVVLYGGMSFHGEATARSAIWDAQVSGFGGEGERGTYAAISGEARTPMQGASVRPLPYLGGSSAVSEIIAEQGRSWVLFVFGGEVTSWQIDRPADLSSMQVLATGVPRVLSIDDWAGAGQGRIVAGGPTAHVAVERTAHFTVVNDLAGWFFRGGSGGASAGTLSLTFPDGSSYSCNEHYPIGSRCSFPNFDFPVAAPPGDYSVHFTGAIATGMDAPPFVVIDAPIRAFIG